MEWHSGRVTNAINFLKTLHTSSERTVVHNLCNELHSPCQNVHVKFDIIQ